MMIDLREVYGNKTYWHDYNPMLQSMGYEIVIQVDVNDYQGDSRLLMRDGERYGILIFGWGSCYGCDALKACNTLDEVSALRDELVASIKWFDNSSKCLEYVNNHDWQGDYSWHADETREFVDKAKTYLSEKDNE